MTAFIYAGSFFLPVIAACLLRRISREYRTLNRLSLATSTSVWLLYLAYVFFTSWSAWISVWALPISLTFAVAAGSILLLAGVVFCAAGIAAFGSVRRMSGIQTDKLVTSDVYRWSRNPQNVGLGIALIGAAVLGRSGFSLLLAGFFWIILGIYLPMEEAHLRRLFGASYIDYCQHTPRYLGLPD